MTSEIVLMNKQAAALAADSAITYRAPGGKKHFQSANKIFTLSKYHPVGVMIFDNSQFMEVPWETIIKDYRERLRDQHFPALNDYADDFLDFLGSNRVYSPERVQTAFFDELIRTYYEDLRSRIDNRWQEAIQAEGSLTTPELIKIAKETVKQDLDHWRTDHDPPSSVPEGFTEDLEDAYKDNINELKRSVFEDLLTSTISRFLTQLALEVAAKIPMGGSGLVVVGFGQEEIFPCENSYYIGGVLADQLIYHHSKREAVDYGNRAVISAFAQREMVVSFLEGIDPRFHEFIMESVSDLIQELPEHIVDGIGGLDDEEKDGLKEKFTGLGEDIFEEFKELVARYSHELHVGPVIEVVAALPKDELAQMAESLVYLTVMKRRISLQEESVAEPIDVAVISKGDGFVWINRKHYFPSDLNIGFENNYFRHWFEPSKGSSDEQDG